MTTTTMLEPGSYSTGTLRDEDMADMFDTIGAITGCAQCRGEAERTLTILNDMGQPGDYWSDLADDSADISECLVDLFDHVEEAHTPEGYYFGAIEGDGADFGVFPIEEM